MDSSFILGTLCMYVFTFLNFDTIIKIKKIIKHVLKYDNSYLRYKWDIDIINAPTYCDKIAPQGCRP
jgi:hypothetical protein